MSGQVILPTPPSSANRYAASTAWSHRQCTASAEDTPVRATIAIHPKHPKVFKIVDGYFWLHNRWQGRQRFFLRPIDGASYAVSIYLFPSRIHGEGHLA